jgi:hypothetical protein
MIKTLEAYFKFREWKTGNNKPSTKTAIGKFSDEVWNGAFLEKDDVKAIQWLIDKRQQLKQK